MIRSAARLERIGHAHSERADGAIGSASVEGHAAARARVVRAAGGDPAALVVPHQVHGACVAVVGERDRGTVIPATDGLATHARGVPLLVQGADCPLVLLADEAAGAVAVLHSGWRGTAAQIGAEGVRVLATLGARPERTVAAIFPGIGPCCFEVGPEVGAAFRETFGPRADAWTRAGAQGTDRSFLDLAAAIRATLTGVGLAAGAIDVIAGCTMCGGRFFSHRGSRGGPGRHGLAAVVR